MAEASAADRVARWVVVALVAAAAFTLNDRFVLAHFALGSDLRDTGWFAWIMASGDFWLTNPRSIDGLSYFNYHLAPYLSAISLLVHATGLDRFTAFALHEGAVFALVAGGLGAIVATSWAGARSAILLGAVAIFSVLGDTMLQMASFPHFEVAIPGLCLVGVCFWQNGRRVAAALSFAVACLVREDGGLYVAAMLFGLALMPPVGRRTFTSPEAMLGAAAVVVALLMFSIKSRFFPGFSAFQTNYSGNNWDHLTPASLQLRFATFLRNPHALTSIVPALLLTLVAWRYGLFVLFMAPLIVAQLLAARVPLWEFRDYYTMPFLVIWAGMVIVAADRARRGKLRLVEPLVMLAFAIAGSGPFLYVVQPPGWFPVTAVALVTPVPDLPKLAERLQAEVAGVPGECVSMGVAALIPNSFAPEQVIEPGSDLSRCRTVFLFNHDGHYNALSWRVALWARGATLEQRVERYDQRP